MHVTQLPSGSWRVTVKRAGQRRTATARTKTEAVSLGNDLYADLVPFGGSDRPTVRELVDRRRRTATHWRPTTADSMRYAAKKIPDVLMDTRADAVTVAIVEDAYELIEAGASQRRHVHSLLTQAFTEGVRIGVLRSNIMLAVHRPRATARTVDPPTPDQVARLLEHSADVAGLGLRIAATTGMRRGEVVAIEWTALDLDATTDHLLVAQSLAYTSTAGVHTVPTKTGQAGHRRITLDPTTVALLRRHRARQAAHGLEHELPRPRWVMSDDAGVTPWRPERLSDEFAAARDELGLDGHTLHSLRHFAATQQLAHGVPVRVVSYRLGHSTVQTTERIYAHWIPGLDAGAADLMARIVAGT